LRDELSRRIQEFFPLLLLDYSENVTG
jgi:hypothetical protein